MKLDEHRAWREQESDDTWAGGCKTCGTSFSGATREGSESWCSGHDSAVGCAEYRARIELEAALDELRKQWERAHLDECRSINKETGRCPSEEDEPDDVYTDECRWPMPPQLRD